ncbi:MAG: hypothetical protein ACO1N0_02515 [Fluviicola sp.]
MKFLFFSLFLSHLAIGQNVVSNRDTLSWWKNPETINHSQLIENKPFLFIDWDGLTNTSRIIHFNCRYKIPGLNIESFSKCDSTFNFDKEINEWIQGDYEQLNGNAFPNCLLPFLQSLPIGTILYFDDFITICPDCIARKRHWAFQATIID